MGCTRAINLFGSIATSFFGVIKDMVVTQKVSSDVAGPIGIAVLTGEVARLGIAYLLNFAALLSLNLAFINVLPFPGLDGGRVLFVVIESIRRKPLSSRIESMIHTVGFGLLLLLVLAITVHDIGRYSSAIGTFVGGIVK